MRKNYFYVLICAFFCAAMLLSGCGKEGSNGNSSKNFKLEPGNPITLTVWHYYNGSQQTAFDELISIFNDTVGKEKGIFVEGQSQGAVADLENAVRDAAEGKVGAGEMPDIFSASADTAFELEEQGILANLSDYMTDEELDQYVDSYIEEGKIAKDNTLRIFPTAKSTEIMMINTTDWQAFADETGCKLSDLGTIEGVTEVSQKYYEWTDAATPDVANDGKAFYGRDSLANYFSIGMRQMGTEIFQAEDGAVQVNIPKEAVKRLWDNYYVPMVKGYFAAYGKFRSDDVKTGDLIAYTGSSASAMYFPSQVEAEGGSHEISYEVMMAPIFDGGENFAVQQGAGMVVSKSDEEKEYAAVEFLKWFTQAENNLQFGSSAGYLPVLKEANETAALDKVIEEKKLDVAEQTYACLTTIFDNIDNVTLYTNKSFKQGSDARKVLEYNLSDKAAEDREAVKAKLEAGKSMEEATAAYVSDEAFETWYGAFAEALKEAAGVSEVKQ